MIKRIDHLNIVVSDLESAKKFFLLLGFEEVMASDLDPAFLQRVTGIKDAAGRFIALKHPGSELSLEILQFAAAGTPEEGIGRGDKIGFRHLAFAVDNIEATVSTLKEHGVEFLTPIQTWEKTGKRLVYFHGPDGILMELAQYPRRRN